jgi:hypothetical protein
LLSFKHTMPSDFDKKLWNHNSRLK